MTRIRCCRRRTLPETRTRVVETAARRHNARKNILRLSPAFMLRLILWLVFAVCAGAPVHAHDIPSDIRLNAFFKPEGGKLRLLLRVPMSAMREVDFPKRGPGYLEISRADEALRQAVKLWLIDSIDVYEDGARLAAPA